MSTKNNLPALISDDGLQQYLRQVNSIPSLEKEEEFLLAKDYLERQDLAAAHRLVVSHLKLVTKIALQYRNYGLPVVDLVSEGNLGLMQAVKKYNPDLGHRLSTYAMWWIKASIQEYVLKSWSLVKIGTTAAQKKLFFSLGKIKRKISNTYGRAVDSRDHAAIAEELGVSEKEVSDMSLRLSGPDKSLNNPLSSEDDSAELIDVLPSEFPSHEVTLMHKENVSNKKQVLVQAMKTLNEREANILSSRKLADSPTTLEELSTKYSISKERVRQIENRAFEKVQAYVLEHVADDGQFKRAN